MHQEMNLALAVSLTALCSLCVSRPAGAAPPEICGEFRCEGENPRGGTYLATVAIAKQQAVYAVKWTLPSGEHGGVGILEGDLLSVSWLSKEGVGIVVYKIRDNGDTLVGRWAQLGGDGRTFSEVLSRAAEQKRSPSMAGGGPPPAMPAAAGVAGRGILPAERTGSRLRATPLAQRGGAS